MEDLYYINNDCVSELSYLIINDDISLFELSSVSHHTKSLFFMRHLFQPDQKCTTIKFKKFKYVKFLDISRCHKHTNLKDFKQLERLTLSHNLNKMNFTNHSKLTYLNCPFNSTFIDVLKCINLVQLNICYVKGIEYLIHLNCLTTIYTDNNDDVVDFSALNQLTKLNVSDRYRHSSRVENKQIIIFNDKLIDLTAEFINFNNQILNSKQIKKLELLKCHNVICSNLYSVETMKLEYLKSFNVIDQDNSYRYLTRLSVDIETNTLQWDNMLSLKNIECKQLYEINVFSTLNSLHDMYYEYRKRYSFDMINLSQVTYLNFGNFLSPEDLHLVKFHRNLKYLKINDFSSLNRHRIISKTTTRANCWPDSVLNQINNMEYLTKLEMCNIIFSDDENKILLLCNTNLLELYLQNSDAGSFDKLKNLTSLTLCCVKIDSINFEPLINLKILTLRECACNNSIWKCNDFVNLEILQLINFNRSVNMQHFPNVIQLKVSMHSGNVRILNLNQLQHLKTIELNSFDIFLKFCKKGFPRSVRDIYISYYYECEIMKDLANITLKNINVHFVKC